MIGSDVWIRKQCIHPTRMNEEDYGGATSDTMHTSLHEGQRPIVPMISPFFPNQVREQHGKRILSYGTSSYGYDIQLQPVWKFPRDGVLLDPKLDCDSYFDTAHNDHFVIEPHGFVLGVTKEWFNMPDNVLGICVGKSTYARLGLVVNVTPLEPGWKGHLVVELSNTTHNPLKVYANEGIAQLLFHINEECAVSYEDRAGKYQNQTEIVLPRL